MTNGEKADRFPWGGAGRVTSDRQVVVGVGVLLGLLAIAVGVGALLIVSLKDDATDVSRRNVQYASAIHEAALSAKAMANEQRGFLISGNPEYLEQLDRDGADARASFALALHYAGDATQRIAVEEAQSGFERWLSRLQADIAAYQSGDEKRAIQASLGSTRQLRKTYERSLASAYELGVRSIESATDSLSSSATRSVTILLVYLAVALIVGIAVAVWVVRVILGPTFALSRNAIEVLTKGRLLVEDDGHGSHHAIKVEVPVEVVNALAESALRAQEGLRPRANQGA